MIQRVLRAAAMLSVLLGPRAVPAGESSMADSTGATAARAREVLERELATIKGAERGQAVPVVDDALPRVFSGDLFYALRFRQYPVAILPPDPLATNNLFVVRADGSVQHLADVRALEAFFRAALPSVTTDGEAKDAAKAWLRLAQEFRQDGFLQFSIADDSLKVVPLPNGDREVTGKAQVDPHGGNQGEVSASLTFEGSGHLLTASESANIKRGVRPICQATKLLDPDPIVRRMAEDSILVMGKAAKECLDEQRAGARPALRDAIDRIWRRIVIEDR